MAIAILFIILGLIGLFVGFSLVKNPLNVYQLSMNVFRSKKTKEHGAGLSWKWLWFELQGKPIDMRATLIITSGGIIAMNWDDFMSQNVYKKIDPKVYETKDGILYGSWAAPLRPAKGYLKNLLLKTPQVGALMIMSKIDLKLSDYLAKKLTEDVLRDKQAIGDMVGELFGGDDEEASSDEETRYGVIVGNPQLFDLSFGKKSQEAAERRFETIKFRESMEDLEKQISDPDKRSNAIFIANGLVKKNILNIEGLENATKNIANAFATIFTKKS